MFVELKTALSVRVILIHYYLIYLPLIAEIKIFNIKAYQKTPVQLQKRFLKFL